MNSFRSLAYVATALFAVSGMQVAKATITPGPLFTDNAVFQQNQPIPVWGTADPNEPITVSIKGQNVKTVSGSDGNWSVRLKPIRAGGPYTLNVAGAANDKVTLNNILVGEVWICSGQSNMEYPMKGWTQPAFSKEAIPASADPLLHFVIVPHNVGITPQTTVGGAWQEATVDTVPNLSAVGYFFGRELRKALHVPVGLIHDNWGGTPAQAWTSHEALAANPAFHHYLKEEYLYPTLIPLQLVDYYNKLDKYNADLQKFQADVAAAKTAGNPIPTNAPQSPRKPVDNEHWPNGASHLYNGMIAPIIPYGIRGAIWYQGESNGGDGYGYKSLFPAMITDWRTRWGQGDFPFLFVQLAPFMPISSTPLPKGANSWADLREAQRQTLNTLPNTGMAVITDLGDVKDIHPRRKEPVGVRLALIARANVYGQNVEYSGPVYKAIEKFSVHRSFGNGDALTPSILNAKPKGDQPVSPSAPALRVWFWHAKGLKAIEVHNVSDDGDVVAPAGKLVGFEVAGADGEYFTADAIIDGDSVVVSSPNVKSPVAVRYGWANYPVANLSNGAGLPASPFKTDNWPWASEPSAFPGPPK
ncbi:MAG: sialate O-acetylesterase [Capsulimonadaceae bacterium]|nr:sialate O-acetylesterase [Capsulimonadaceae bacterium]